MRVKALKVCAGQRDNRLWPPKPRPPPARSTLPPPERGAGSRHARRFGLPVATALVMGNIIGGGIFLLPVSVAPYGTISLVAFGVLTVGAIALALVFGRLAQRAPRTGGPYVYVREAFGDFAGFLAAWSYWIASWVSNAALAVTAVGYLDVLLPLYDSPWLMMTAALVVQWLPAFANLAGTRYVDAVQLASTVLKFVPLLLVAIGGLFFFDPGSLGPFQASEGGALGAVSASAAILLFSYLGVESAAVSAGEVRNPRVGTSGGRPSSARSARRWCTCWAPSRSSAPSRTTSCSPPAPPSPTPSTPCSAARGAARRSPAQRSCRSWAHSTAGRCSAPRPRTPPPATACSRHASR